VPRLASGLSDQLIFDHDAAMLALPAAEGPAGAWRAPLSVLSYHGKGPSGATSKLKLRRF